MKVHTKIYFEFFGFDSSSFVPCEVCERGAVDIHHIENRKIGGTNRAESVINLMAVCRICHMEYGDKKQHKTMLRSKHIDFMLKRQESKTRELLLNIYNA